MAKYSVSYVYEIIDKYSRNIDKIKRKTYEASRAAKEASLRFKEFGKKMAVVGTKMTVALTTPILLLGRSMLNAASDAEETRSKYSTVFKELGIGAENTADKFAKSFGLAGSTARKLIGDTGDMLTGFGFTSEAALKLSERTNELAVDLASFTNFSGGAEGASAALTKALLGERESVKSLGIAILESDVKKKIAQMRSDGIRFATEREAKAYATLEIAISQSKNAIGDYERTKLSFANVQRRVSQRNLELRESFGKVMIPAATKALNVIDKLQEKFIGLDDVTKKIIVVFLGLLAVIGPLLLAIGMIGMIAPFVVTGFGLIVAGIALLLGPIGIAIAVIALLVAAFKFVWKYNEKFRNGIISLGKTIKEIFSSIKDFLSPFFSWLFGHFDRLIGFISGVGGKVLGAIGFDFDQSGNPAAEGVAGKKGADGTVNVRAEKGTEITKTEGNVNPMNLGKTVAMGR